VEQALEKHNTHLGETSRQSTAKKKEVQQARNRTNDQDKNNIAKDTPFRIKISTSFGRRMQDKTKS
jgi:hypothetical protein